MGNPVFSVIVPVYNQDAYVEECVNSVLLQNFPEVELLLVNDGSNDRSAEILDRIYEEHPNEIRVIHQENRGVFEARHAGFDAASGSYVLFLDADDRLSPESLSVLNGEIRKNQPDLILFEMTTNRSLSDHDKSLPFQNGEIIADKRKLFQLMGSGYLLNHMGIKCIKRTLITEEAFSHPKDLRLSFAEDLYLTIPVVAGASRVEYLDQKLYFYRDNEEGATYRYDRDMYLAMIETVNRLRHYAGEEVASNYAGLECYNIATKVFRSSMSFGEKRRELRFIKDHPFYRQYGVNSIRMKTGYRKVLAHLFRSDSLPAAGLLELLYRFF